MNRRHFLQSTLAATTVSATLPSASAKRPLVNAYYLRAHMYTLVPRHVREDMRWMADAGTNVVSLAVLEQDLTAAVENLNLICEEAGKVGMNVFVVPSRWGGLLAGAPKVPSLFSVLNPQTWMLAKNGKPYQNNISGVTSSVHYAETYDFFCASVEKIAKLFPVKGLVWDEPKQLETRDYSPLARKAIPDDGSPEPYIKAHADFYGRVNAFIRTIRPEWQLSMFIYASSDDLTTRIMAQTPGLNYYGCDGRPWSENEGGQLESKGKSLIDQGQRFIDAAKQNGKKSLFLVENHNMPARDIPLMERGLSQVLAMQPDQFVYYYFPRNIGEPERNMAAIARTIKNL